MITVVLLAALATGQLQCGPGGCPPARYAPASPALHVLADNSGKPWSSPDPAWLAQWVAQENTRIAAKAAKPAAKPATPAQSPAGPSSQFPTGVVAQKLPHLPPGGVWYGGNVGASKSGTVGATEDGGPDVYLTVIGSEAERKAVVEALARNPELSSIVSAMGDRLAVHDYAPDEPMVADVGLPNGGRPDIVIQNASGKVQYRAKDDPGPTVLAAELRRADPHYNPANDPTGGWSLKSLERFFGNAEEQAPLLLALLVLGGAFIWKQT